MLDDLVRRVSFIFIDFIDTLYDRKPDEEVIEMSEGLFALDTLLEELSIVWEKAMLATLPKTRIDQSMGNETYAVDG